MRIDKILITLLLFFPWRSEVWEFDDSEALFSILILLFVLTLSLKRKLLISNWSYIILGLVSIIFIYYRYFDVALIVRVLLPLILVPFFRHFKISQRELRFLAIVSLVFVCFNYIPAASILVDPFKGRVSTGLLSYQYYRASGLHIYPSDFSFFSLLLIIRLRKSILLKGLLALAIVLSASRAGILFLLIYFFYRYWLRFLFWGTLSLPALPFLYENSPYIKLTISKLLQGEIDGSVKHRTSELTYVWDVITLRFDPVLKDYSNLGLSILEGFYSYYIINYGYLGLILVVILVLYLMFSILNSDLSRESQLFVLCCLLLWFLASDILNHTKNLFFGYLLIFSSRAVHYKYE